MIVQIHNIESISNATVPQLENDTRTQDSRREPVQEVVQLRL